MAITVSYNDKPVITDIGKATNGATVINSGLSGGVVQYQVRRRDGQDQPKISTGVADITIASNEDSLPANVASVSRSQLVIHLPSRQRFKVRVKLASDSTWGSWFNFKTTDKNYGLAASITDQEISDDTNPTAKGAKTITVTNLAEQTVEYTSAGATVTNTKTQYNDVSSITYTSSGATIVTRN